MTKEQDSARKRKREEKRERRAERAREREQAQAFQPDEAPPEEAGEATDEGEEPAGSAAAQERELEIFPEADSSNESRPVVEPAERQGWLRRMRGGLSSSRSGLVEPLERALAAHRFDDDFWMDIEDILVSADVGIPMTREIVAAVKDSMGRGMRDPRAVLELFQEIITMELNMGATGLNFNPDGPTVIMVVGVNGTGKTTTIAKLANYLQEHGHSVLLAAADTFRAAAIEQLETWGERAGIHTVRHQTGADAAAVAYDAVEAAIARSIDVVIVDTAGRLHTKVNLMEELKKIKRIVERKVPVSEVLLAVDATTGQNGLIQARQFKDVVGVTGLVLTKLDGTAKGGIAIAIEYEMRIPIKFIGVGESMDDLLPFEPEAFAAALFS